MTDFCRKLVSRDNHVLRGHIYKVLHNQNLPAVRVPSSTSNLGSGFDFLGLALDFWLEARIVEGESPPIYSGAMEGFDPAKDFVAEAVTDTVPSGYHLEVTSDIPVSRGLGSSAAAYVAGHALAGLARDGFVEKDTIFEIAADREGHPDNAGPAVFGGMFLHAGFPKRLKFHDSLGVAVAIPEQTLSTKAARGILPERFSRNDTIGQASRAAALLLGLTNGDGELISHGLVDHIAVPARRSLIAGFDDAVSSGIEAGAFGVTISGAGSALVAICLKEETTEVANAVAGALNARGNRADAHSPNVVESGMVVLGGAPK